MLIENELVEWQLGNVEIPDHYRVARMPMELREADIIHVKVGRSSPRMLRSPDGQTFESSDSSEQRLHTLAQALANPAVPAPKICVAPAYFLSIPNDCASPSLQQLMAPGVSFPEAMLLPDSCIKRRVDLSSGAQIAIPEPIRHARIERLHLSEKTLDQLRQAKLETLGDLLSQEEESLKAALDPISLWEVYVALCQKQALPQYTHPFEAPGIDGDPQKSGKVQTKTPHALPVSGWLSAELLEEADLGQPAFPTVYLQMTGVTYDDAELGQLHLVYVSPFVDCFDGKRSGPVNTIWLTQAQIDQSRPWDRDFERLDVLEAREQVAKYARVRGAIPPEVRPVERSPREYDKVRHQQQEQYRIVPLKDPDNPVSKDSSGEEREKPLELFIGSRDLAEAQAKRESQTAMMRRVIRRYINHPTAQSLGVPLSRCVLQDIYDWLGKDRDKRRELPSGRIRPYGPNLIMHKEYRYHERLFPNQGGEMVWQNVPDEVVGYRVIIGVLVITQVEDDLIVHPRESKPVSPVPERPIRQSKWPNYVPIQEAMVA
jgi:hypothetical protein